MIKLGLDIGRRSVKLVRVELARRSIDLRSIKGASRELDPALEGAKARDALVKAIRECAQELRVGREPVAIAVPRAEAVLKTVYLPPVSPEERARLIRFQAAKDVPFELSEVVLASGVVGEAPQPKNPETPAVTIAPLEVNYAAVRTSVLDGLRALVREAGLVPGSLELSTQAAARAARLLAPGTDDAVLLLVGALASEIVILRKGRISFSRSASVGAAGDPKWLDKLVNDLQLSLRAAAGGPAAAAGALAPGLAQSEDMPKTLLLAGGGVKEAGIATTLGARLGIPARTLEPLGAGSSPSFIVARGLADPRAVDGIPVLDFAGIADATAARQTKQKGMLFGGIAAALVITTVLLVHSRIAGMEDDARDFAAQMKTLKPDMDAASKLLHEVKVVQDWEQKKKRNLDILLAVSKALPKDEAYLTRFQWTEGKGVMIGGRVKDQDAADKFVRLLAKDPIVERATRDFLRESGEKHDASKGFEFGATVKLHEIPQEKVK
jgi:Tfp pilus assembly PilM family ATPase